ncbi:MAG: phosphoribosylformylglycinamidine synthase I [Candidatus Eremiobacteraeota bacterium]|nr:phosphoribosylformylglycinamidine synthase I [Candidatus Eremiobacteraeota bacterium]MBC5828378.1 phosphoribosylformylglycinamidine synthase I [Candidatus Eremiobacteraeota bacterium]
MKVAVLVFPGTNSEEETVAACADAGMDACLINWNQPPENLTDYDGFVLPGGFAHEDRVRAGAIAARSSMVSALVQEAGRGKLVLGICNGAQILAESGLLGEVAIGRNLPARHFQCRYVDVRVDGRAERCAFTNGLETGTRLRMALAHGEGRFRGDPSFFDRLEEDGRIVLRYDGRAPNGAMHDAAGICNSQGNVLAIMPHPERAAWAYTMAFGDPASREGDPNRTVGAHALFRCMAANLSGKAAARS